jgi:tRNA pseudouridine13 synthase
VEKRNLGTPEAAALLGRAVKVQARDVGYAGLKDKRAVTRQWFSLAVKDATPLQGLEVGGLKVLKLDRHGNKLRTGHLRGNRFVLQVRGVGAGAGDVARAVLERLQQTGVPHYYGPQRFGRDGTNAALGEALLRGTPHPLLASAQRDRFLKRMALSAFQSELFNRLLARRLTERTWSQALVGDVLQKETNACFVCDDPSVDQPRLDAFEVSVSGPMFGPKLLAARGAARAIEEDVLAQAGVTEALFEAGGELTQGARRPLRIRLSDVDVALLPDGVLRVSFGLPRGGYASVVMAEVMKAHVELPDEEPAAPAGRR